ncbi:MAG: endonuclease domain-containing protein [Actinomycetota bacterium]
MVRARPQGWDAERSCEELAASRHWVIARWEALALGMTAGQIERRLASERLRRLHATIYVVGAAPATGRQTLMGACLWGRGGTAASHRSAAHLLQLDGFGDEVVEISTPRHLKTDKIIVHRTRPIPPADIVTVDRIPTTYATTTLLELGAVVESEAVEMALDAALRRGLTSVPRLRWRFRRLDGRGRKGMGELREMLVSRGDGGPPTDSAFEIKLSRLLRRHGLPRSIRQYVVREADCAFVARPDFAYPHARLAIEAVNYRWHSGKRAWQRDLVRLDRLTAAGWRVIHVTWDDVTLHEGATAARIRRELFPRLAI